MDSHALAVIRPAVLALLLVSAAACGSGPGTSPTPSAPTPVTPSPVAASPGAPGATPRAARTADAAGDPPVATLAGPGVAGVPGDLGSFSWDGLVSDAPWILAPVETEIPSNRALTVAFDTAGLAPSNWRATWAPIVDGEPGPLADGGSGAQPGIGLAAPGSPGAWSLQLTGVFGSGRTATWYWRIAVVP